MLVNSPWSVIMPRKQRAKELYFPCFCLSRALFMKIDVGYRFEELIPSFCAYIIQTHMCTYKDSHTFNKIKHRVFLLISWCSVKCWAKCHFSMDSTERGDGYWPQQKREQRSEITSTVIRTLLPFAWVPTGLWMRPGLLTFCIYSLT